MFRHQQNASMNKDDDVSSERGGLKGFYSYKNTFDEDAVWLEIPKEGVNEDFLFLPVPPYEALCIAV